MGTGAAQGAATNGDGACDAGIPARFGGGALRQALLLMPAIREPGILFFRGTRGHDVSALADKRDARFGEWVGATNGDPNERGAFTPFPSIRTRSSLGTAMGSSAVGSPHTGEENRETGEGMHAGRRKETCHLPGTAGCCAGPRVPAGSMGPWVSRAGAARGQWPRARRYKVY